MTFKLWTIPLYKPAGHAFMKSPEMVCPTMNDQDTSTH